MFLVLFCPFHIPLPALENGNNLPPSLQVSTSSSTATAPASAPTPLKARMDSPWTQFWAFLSSPWLQPSPATHFWYQRPSKAHTISLMSGCRAARWQDWNDKCDCELHTLSCRLQGSIEGFKAGESMIKVVFGRTECRRDLLWRWACIGRDASPQ